MKRVSGVFFVVLFLVSLAGVSFATNGDNLIGIGPIARSMGGVGIADPLDAISAVFANPAAMCFGPYCPGTEVNFAGTLFMPSVSARVSFPNGTFTTTPTPLPPGASIGADSDDKVYAIPAIGLSLPITDKWRFGLAAYGVSGLGVDYRNTSIDQPSFYFGGAAPLVAGEYTQLQIMKFSPSIAYQVNNNLSLGLGVQVDYANLDLRNGSSFNYAIGAQVGGIYKISDSVRIGATYVSPQEVDYENVLRNPTNPQRSTELKLEQPQQVGIGISYEPMKDILLFEVDGKWINWSSATGYDDFDWDDQWVLAVGAQYKPTKKIALRVGYNYANNPVNEHNGWNGAFNPATGAPFDVKQVQGLNFPRYYYETFRIIGFPAIVKQHVTFGIGYEISNRFALNAGYTHAFEETITESGTSPEGQPVTLSSKLSEDSVEFGFTWRF